MRSSPRPMIPPPTTEATRRRFGAPARAGEGHDPSIGKIKAIPSEIYNDRTTSHWWVWKHTSSEAKTATGVAVFKRRVSLYCLTPGDAYQTDKARTE